MTRLADAAWPEIGARPLVLVPVGSIEQHGPHLPLDTDTAIAAAAATSVAEMIDAYVAPPLYYGSSGEHQMFPGTSSIGTDALQATVIELVRSMSTWADRIVFVNAHGGNLAALAAGVAQMITEQHDVAWVPCAAESDDLHAGATETSLMLHIRPQSVRLELVEPGDARGLDEIMPLLVAEGVASVSPNGILGDPTGASAESGQRVLEAITTDLVERICVGAPRADGMLSGPAASTVS